MKRVNIFQRYFLIARPYIFTIVIIFLMSEIISIVCLGEVFSGIWFTLFQVVGVLIPGTACLLGWGWTKRFDWEACAISYVGGYIFSLFVYFALMLCGLRLYVQSAVFAIFLVCSIFIFLKKKNVDSSIDNIVVGQSLILISVWSMFSIVFFVSCCNNLLPPIVKECSPVHDLLYWVGDIIELTKEFPPKNFRNYPLSYSYHYFSSAQLALASLFTSIRPIHIGLFFSVVQSVLLRVFSGYLVLSKCTRKNELQIIGMILLFFSSGYESKVIITYLAHSYHASFGLDYGLAIFLIFLYLLLTKVEENNNLFKTSVLIWLCIFVLAGEKISYGGIGLFGLGILCIGFLIKKDYRKALITGLPALVIFILEYYLILNMSRYVNASSSSTVSNILFPLWRTQYTQELVQQIYGVTSLFSLPVWPWFLICFVLFSSPVCFFSVLYNSWRLFVYNSWDIIDGTFLAMYLTGLGGMLFVQMFGLSNMYFAFASFPVAIIWLLKCRLPWSRIGKIAFVIAASFSIVGFANGYANNKTLLHYVSDGLFLMRSGMVSPNAKDDRTYVDMEEYKAYEWIRLNSKNNAIIVTNRESRVVGALTERYIISPRKDNSVYARLSEGGGKGLLHEYKKRGVEFIVFEEKYGRSVEYIDGACDVAYQSGNIKIYAVP